MRAWNPGNIRSSNPFCKASQANFNSRKKISSWLETRKKIRRKLSPRWLKVSSPMGRTSPSRTWPIHHQLVGAENSKMHHQPSLPPAWPCLFWWLSLPWDATTSSRAKMALTLKKTQLSTELPFVFY